MEQNILSINDLTISLKKNQRILLNNINFNVSENDVLSLTGYNGSGKSTLLKTLAGNITHGRVSDYQIDSGSINFLGENILEFEDKQLQKYRSQIAYIKQEDVFPPGASVVFFVEDRLAAAGINYSQFEIKEKIHNFFPKNEEKNITYDTDPTKLSGGQKKLLSIFLETISKPNAKLYLIDEPLNNLDFKNAGNISNLINQIHRNNPTSAIVMVTHCRIITCINRAIELDRGVITNSNVKYECHNCYGKPDDCGMYL